MRTPPAGPALTASATTRAQRLGFWLGLAAFVAMLLFPAPAGLGAGQGRPPADLLGQLLEGDV